jgi:hypothetical protein
MAPLSSGGIIARIRAELRVEPLRYAEAVPFRIDALPTLILPV